MAEEYEARGRSRMAVLALRLLFLGFILTFIGIVAVIAAAFLQGQSGQSNVSGAVVIFVGPIPVILGVGPYSFYTILLAVVLTIVGFVAFFLMRRQLSKS
jgi:uncharacterized membrane protein